MNPLNFNALDGVNAGHAAVEVKVTNPTLQKASRLEDITPQVLAGQFDDQVRNKATNDIQMKNLDTSV